MAGFDRAWFRYEDFEILISMLGQMPRLWFDSINSVSDVAYSKINE